MTKIKTNLPDVITKLTKGISEITHDKITREMCTSVLGEMMHRIFVEGKDSEGKSIGKYSEGYLKTRTKYGWGDEKKVILQLTQRLFFDFGIIADGNGWGLGVHNDSSKDKIDWVEEHFRGVVDGSNYEIFTPSEKEKKNGQRVVDNYIKNKLKL